MNDTFTITLVVLTIGLAALIIGLVARSVRVALGCAATSAVVALGFAVAMWLWQFISDWQAFRVDRLK
jgi:hypothetical protein